MPAIARTEFALALNQVCAERGIDPAVVIETIKAAILAAFRKDFPQDFNEAPEDFTVDLNPETGEAKVLHGKKDVTPPGFGRIAAQTAKQVILQRIREAEKSAILADYSGRVGTLINGMILRFDGPNIIVDIGKTEAVMPPQEQIPRERYRLNQRLLFYIEGIRQSQRGSEIVVSRSHKDLVERLFQREVPEVAAGSVEIIDIAREAGSRSKIAVYSNQSGVDPVGSCVGQKGVRVQTVMAELGEERIDIIQYNKAPDKFILNALSPAKNGTVILNEKKKTAIVVVPDGELSLAIGKEGQNARLAAKLTKWKIDIKGETEAKEEAKKKTTKKAPKAVKKDTDKKKKPKKTPKKTEQGKEEK
jgi:N utilization substance protein A